MLHRRDLERHNRELHWRRYRNDHEAFFREVLWVPSQRDSRGREKFDLFDYQAEDLRTLLDNKFVIGLKARQIGWSTLIAGVLLHRCIFFPGTVGLWVSNNQENADKAIGMLKVMWNFLPPWVRERAPRLTADQAGRKEWTFPDGMTSRIRALAGTATAGASETASIAVLDEFGLVDGANQDDLYRSVEPTTDAGGQLWILSTARGAHNRFAQMFKAAQRGDSKFVPMFRPWTVSRFVNPLAGTGQVDDSIYRAKAKEFASKPWLIHAEYPLTPEEAFRESGNPRYRGLPEEDDCFDGWVRGRMGVDPDSGDQVFVPDEAGPLRVREDLVDGPDDWREHVVYLDPSGQGEDFHAGQVLTFDDDGLPDVCAWWRLQRAEPVEVAREFNLLGRWFRGSTSAGAALLAVENTGGWGDSIINELHHHMRYPNMYRHVPASAHRRKQRQARIGFPMNVGTRPSVVDRLGDYLRPDQVLGHLYPELRGELVTFVQTETGKIQADVGCHDDLVMSCAGGLWVLTEDVRATRRLPVEKPVDGDPPVRVDLKGMFARIEAKRREQQESDAREDARWARQSGRRRARTR